MALIDISKIQNRGSVVASKAQIVSSVELSADGFGRYLSSDIKWILNDFVKDLFSHENEYVLLAHEDDVDEVLGITHEQGDSFAVKVADRMVAFALSKPETSWDDDVLNGILYKLLQRIQWKEGEEDEDDVIVKLMEMNSENHPMDEILNVIDNLEDQFREKVLPEDARYNNIVPAISSVDKESGKVVYYDIYKEDDDTQTEIAISIGHIILACCTIIMLINEHKNNFEDYYKRDRLADELEGKMHIKPIWFDSEQFRKSVNDVLPLMVNKEKEEVLNLLDKHEEVISRFDFQYKTTPYECVYLDFDTSDMPHVRVHTIINQQCNMEEGLPAPNEITAKCANVLANMQEMLADFFGRDGEFVTSCVVKDKGYIFKNVYGAGYLSIRPSVLYDDFSSYTDYDNQLCQATFKVEFDFI
mgnify:CR=1 FL=1